MRVTFTLLLRSCRQVSRFVETCCSSFRPTWTISWLTPSIQQEALINPVRRCVFNYYIHIKYWLGNIEQIVNAKQPNQLRCKAKFGHRADQCDKWKDKTNLEARTQAKQCPAKPQQRKAKLRYMPRPLNGMNLHMHIRKSGEKGLNGW